MKTQVLTMLELQDAMNRKVNPDWREAGNAWYRAIWTECAEMLDHYGWKWWKHQKPDMQQVKLEVVDIWHFVMSDLLQENAMDAVADQVESSLSVRGEVVDIRTAIEALAQITLQSRSANVPAFAVLMQAVDMDFDELFRMYVGKNVLNFFRQDHGYKDGSYIKVWKDREDNEYLSEILGKLDARSDDFAEQVYRQLEAVYPA